MEFKRVGNMVIGSGYKLFRQDREGNLHPLYVLSKETIPVNEWVLAKDNAPQTKEGKVKGKMVLKYRPGFHVAGSKPEAPQITNQTGCVWCRVEFLANVDYNRDAQERGRNKHGKVIPVKADLNMLPHMGWYFYKTSHKQTEPWIICDRIRITEILTAAQVAELTK